MQDDLILKEKALEHLIAVLVRLDDEILSLRRENEREEVAQNMITRNLKNHRCLEASEKKEIARSAEGIEVKKMYSEKIKAMELRKTEISAAVLQLQGELFSQKTDKVSPIKEINDLKLQLKVLEACLEKKACHVENSNSNVIRLFERLLQLTNRRERAFKSEATRERLRDRISVLKMNHANRLKGEYLDSRKEFLSGATYVREREKILQSVWALKEANLYLSLAVKNIIMSRDCDCSSSHPRDEALNIAASLNLGSAELRKKIADASAKRARIRHQIDKVAELQKRNEEKVKGELSETERKTKHLVSAVKEAVICIRDLESCSVNGKSEM